MESSAHLDNTEEWTPSSWRTRPIKQQPTYSNQAQLKDALNKVKALPPLVHYKEVDSLKNKLALAGNGQMFLIQGGDCAERFIDCSEEPISNKFKILLQMSLIIIWKARVPVVRIARMAGQFAKPRTSDWETVNGEKVLSFKGDNVNSFDVSDREPDPNRLVMAYFHSAATLNYIRAMIAGGVASLHEQQVWNLDSVHNPNTRKEYQELIGNMLDGLNFLNLFHADESDVLKSVEFFTSHEGLLLNYEESLTRKMNGKWVNVGTHFLWIGDRTRNLDGAHIEYFRGISNPIGVKVGPSMTADELKKLVEILNPKREQGKLSLITRYGCEKVENCLPAHIKAVQSIGIPVVWVCDPCHGNTEMTEGGLKTRHFEKIIKELMLTFDIHKREGSHLGGAHLELTGDDVTECVGGSPGLEPGSLSENYETFCDPRLNYTQSLDIAFSLAQKLSKKK